MREQLIGDECEASFEMRADDLGCTIAAYEKSAREVINDNCLLL